MKSTLILLLLGSTLALADVITNTFWDVSRPVITTNGYIEFTAGEGTLMRVPLTNMVFVSEKLSYSFSVTAPVMVSNPQYATYWWMRSLAENYLPWGSTVTTNASAITTNAVSPWPCSEIALIGGITAKIDAGWPETGCQADRAYVLAVWPQLPADLTVVPPARVPR